MSVEVSEIFEESENEGQRSLINQVLSNLELEGKELRWRLIWPFDVMAICNKTQNWLGMRDLFQTFPDELITDEDQVRDIQEIRQLLDESQGNEEIPTC